MYSHLNKILKTNKPLQYMLGVLTLVLSISYIILFTYDLSSIYTIIYNNDKNLKTDVQSEYIIEYDLDIAGTGTLTTDVGDKIEVENVSTAYAHNLKDCYRYNEKSNTLLINLDNSFKFNFLMSESYFVVLFVVLFLCVLFRFTVASGEFTVLSNKKLFYSALLVAMILTTEGVATVLLL